jgi:dienelactone hydrolase
MHPRPCRIIICFDKASDQMKRILLLLTALIFPPLVSMHAAEPFPTPAALWKDYDPNQGAFKEEIVKEETRDGTINRDSYISAYVLGEEVRVYCRYRVKIGAAKAPGLLVVHGWMGAAEPDRKFVEDGWAVMAHDYCGKTGTRPHFTKYPEKLRHGNMDRTVAGPVRSQDLDGKQITDPKQTSDYLWYAIQRRVLSYLEQQKEVDRTRLGATGYSYGGTLMWNLATDPRVKAVAAYFGIGYNDYYRDKQVWFYNVPYVEPPKSSGEEIILASIVPEAHVPFITAATLFLNGSNDHHGGHERGLESFKKFSKNVPWSFAIQARGHHDTEKIGHNTKFWLEKHVLGKDVAWPEHPRSEIRLDAEGVPELVITPASPDTVRKVEMFYALKNPCSYARAWRDTPSVWQGQQWIAKMPVLNVDDYVFGYANITYDTTIVRSTDFNAAIPAKLGKAVATDKPSSDLSGSGYSAWSNIAELEGPKGIQGFRPTNNGRGSGTEQLHDPKWQAPAGSRLSFKFYCTEPQTVVLTAADHNSVEMEITASDDWQEMAIAAGQLINRFNHKPMPNWSSVGKIHFLPKQGSDLTKVIFADFKWVP